MKVEENHSGCLYLLKIPVSENPIRPALSPFRFVRPLYAGFWINDAKLTNKPCFLFRQFQITIDVAEVINCKKKFKSVREINSPFKKNR